MADYFTKFSIVIILPDEAAQKYALDLADRAQEANRNNPGSPEYDACPEFDHDIINNWTFDTHPGDNMQEDQPTFGIWLDSYEGGIDAAIALIQHLLVKYPGCYATDQEPGAGCIALQWANDCSKPRTDAYGGGAALITATAVKTISTAQWIDEQIKLATAYDPALASLRPHP